MSYDDKHNLDSIEYGDDDSYEPYGSRNDLSKTRKLAIGSIVGIVGAAFAALLTSLRYGIASGIRAHNIAQTNEKITQLNAERQCLVDKPAGKLIHRKEISRIDQEILDLSGGKKTR